MNNEINNSHEYILDKYKRTFDNVHYWYQREEILQAMAEVAGLRDKEVEELKDERSVAWNETVILEQQLATKDKEVDKATKKMYELADDNLILEATLHAKDKEIAERRKYWEEMYVEKANDVGELLNEIEQLKAAIKRYQTPSVTPSPYNIIP